MLNQVLATILPLLLWGTVSGVLNLMLTRKSQIEAWVNANPRLAAWSKLLRSIGLDPWALHAWATLLVSKKLPAAQQADSEIAKIEQAKADEKAARKGPPDDPDTTISIMPEPVRMVAQDRSRLHNDIPDDEPAEFRAWDWRVALGFATLLALVSMQLGCPAATKPPCDESKLRAIDKDYAAKVVAVCLPKYDSKDACPEWPALQVEHRRQLKEACP